MQRTILLLDGSEAMNSSSDYLPSYLLAIRTPLYRLITIYLESTPLASLGVVVMRDGVSRKLISPTTNFKDIETVMERDYFLYEGSGALSMVNGIRHAISELVDVKKIIAAVPRKEAEEEGKKAKRGTVAPALDAVSRGVKRRVIMVSASVTVIDPTNVSPTLSLLKSCDIRFDVVSFTGAVHLFESAANLSGGKLYCPLSYDHLLRLLPALVKDDTTPRATKRQKRGRDGAAIRSVATAVGFPLLHVTSNGEHYLLCPQCHLPQSSIPSTCPLCQCLLCDVASLYSQVIRHHHFIPLSEVVPLVEVKKEEKPKVGVKEGGGGRLFCHLCRVEKSPGDPQPYHRCTACHTARCAACETYVRDVVGVCPVCTALV